MNPSSPDGNIDSEQQGLLFNEQIVRSGTTEPTQFKVEAHFDPAPDGVYPETTPQTPAEPDPALTDSLHASTVSKHRHEGQLGKHSPLQRSGSYEQDLRVGDYLPGFGYVTETNFGIARQNARNLDVKRSRRSN